MEHVQSTYATCTVYNFRCSSRRFRVSVIALVILIFLASYKLQLYHDVMTQDRLSRPTPGSQRSGYYNAQSTHDDKRSDSQILTQCSRLNRIRQSCKVDHSAEMGKIFYSEKHKLCYCGVAKAGCTFWKQVIRFLNNDTRGHAYEHPSDIPRSWVHYNIAKNTSTSFYDHKTYFGHFDRFMFSRDPYSRLWSAYIDKIFLPDMWFNYRTNIRKSGQFHGLNVCPLDATFEDSLKWAVSMDLSKMDTHWVPMYYACDPCSFEPDFIGKQETFAMDASYILSRHNLSWIMEKGNKGRNINEVKMLIRYNFGLLKGKVKRCLSAKELSKRLWKTFQYNGHLSDSEGFPEVEEDITEEEFTNLVMKAIDRQNISSERLKFQKLKYLRQAYENVSRHVIEDVRERYAIDFDMFAYDPYNQDIF